MTLPWILRICKRSSLSPLLFNIILALLANAIRQGKTIGKEKAKLFVGDMVIYPENLQRINVVSTSECDYLEIRHLKNLNETIGWALIQSGSYPYKRRLGHTERYQGNKLYESTARR